MEEKFQQFSMSDVTELARSPAGQQLLALLRQSGGESARQAMAKAAAGDLEGAKTLLAPLLADPRIRALLGSLGGS